MSLSNIKQMKKDRGFTIVELLIVIVVIGILAAIVIVAYNGVTQRANTSKAQTNAVTVQKKAEAYFTDTSGGNGVYPATATAFAALAQTTLGAIPTGITLQATNPDNTNGTTNIRYTACATGAANSNTASGYYISYYNFATPGVVSIWGGSSTSASCGALAPSTT